MNNQSKLAELQSIKAKMLDQLDEIKELGNKLWGEAMEADKFEENSVELSDITHELSQSYIKVRCDLLKAMNKKIEAVKLAEEQNNA